MFDKGDIDAAVEAGALTRDQASRFTSFLRTRSDPDKMLDPENLRFLTNFNDVFLSIGLGILLFGIGFLSINLLLPMLSPQNAKTIAILAPLPVLAAAWMLAEYFTGRRRLLLPSMLLTCAISVASGVSVAAFMLDTAAVDQSDTSGIDAVLAVLANFTFPFFLAAGIAGLVVHVRFRLPFALFVVALAAAGVFYTALIKATGEGQSLLSGSATLGVGVATLIAAILFDMRDPQRASLTSDNGFWLHMAAAPQIIFGIRGVLTGSGFAPAGAGDAVVMLAVLIGFALLSLALNRRALIVSGLITFIGAVWALFNQIGAGGLNALVLTALLVGGSIVLLGGGWRTARRTLLKFVPSTGVIGRIFPPEPA